MGGRGASAGISKRGERYGSQYKTILEVGNIKFVSKKTRQSEPLMETMTSGRVYVQVGGNDLLRIIRFDAENKRNRVIEHDDRTGQWHVHFGYYHNEYTNTAHGELSASDRELLAKVQRLWDNHLRRA